MTTTMIILICCHVCQICCHMGWVQKW